MVDGGIDIRGRQNEGDKFDGLLRGIGLRI